MAHSLAGRSVGDVLVEFWGPHNGRNHFPSNDAPAPQARGQLFGADAATTVLLEECTTLVIQGTNNSNAIGSFPVRGGKIVLSQDPADWATVATFTVAGGLILAALTPRDDQYGLRLRISAVPASPDPLVGSIELATEWS